MTRFKELRRIEAAMEHRNEPELRWAEDYCRMRLAIATRKEHTHYWQNLQRKIDKVLMDLLESSKKSE